MHSLADAVRRLWRRNAPSSVKPRRLVPVLISVLVLAGTATGVVLATTGGKPAAVGAAAQPIPRTSPAPAKTIGPVVPMLGGSADASGTPIVVPVARASAPASPAAAGGHASPAAAGGHASTASAPARRAPVAPLRGLKQADLLVVAPFSLSGKVRAAVARQSGVTGTEPIEAAKIKINGTFTAVLGVNPSSFRGYTAPSTAGSNKLWQAVAGGGVAVSYTMGTLDRLSLGGQVTVSGRQQEKRLPVMAFGTVGIGGVDAVVSDSVAASLGVPARNALVVSAPPASVPSIAARIKAVLPKGASVEPLVTEVSRPGGLSPVGIVPGTPAGGALTAAQLTTALRAAESRRGLPYVWGAVGPSSFDCSGLVEWSFAQAGISMPRVAADQARTGLSVPVTRLQAGDLLFYHTDPTDPGYISHVAIYLGNGWMIQAPQPGMDVEIVPARFGSQFAGAVRVYPRIAAGLAPGLA
jgi:cell wall-associated NlpC family hydrolase